MLKYFSLLFLLVIPFQAQAVESASNTFQAQLAVAASCGAGNSAGKNMCYKGVKSIIAAGLGKSESCVRGLLSGGRAIDAVKDLKKAGFVDDRSKCNQKGTILVYRGAADGMSEKQAAAYIRKKFGANLTAGDRAGHIEVIGNNGGYYSFLESFRPITQNPRLKGRRILAGCFVMDSKNYGQSKIAKCKGGSARHCGSSSTHKKKGANQ